MNKYVKNIIDTIKEFNWKVKDLWIDDNCIYAKVIKPNEKLEDEGLYAASEDDPKDVCNVFNELQRIFNL